MFPIGGIANQARRHLYNEDVRRRRRRCSAVRRFPLATVAAMTWRKAPGCSPWKKPSEAPGPSPGYYFPRKMDVPGHEREFYDLLSRGSDER